MPCKLIAVHLGHHYVNKGKVGSFGLGSGKSFNAVFSRDDPVAFIFKIERLSGEIHN